MIHFHPRVFSSAIRVAFPPSTSIDNDYSTRNTACVGVHEEDPSLIVQPTSDGKDPEPRVACESLVSLLQLVETDLETKGIEKKHVSLGVEY